ncbi:MAG: methyl-accepting chemotaxis protein [Pseudomonadota bacterium]
MSIATKSLFAVLSITAVFLALLMVANVQYMSAVKSQRFEIDMVVKTEFLSTQINTGTRLKRGAMIAPHIDSVFASDAIPVAAARVLHVEGMEVLSQAAEGAPEGILANLPPPAFSDVSTAFSRDGFLYVSVPIILGLGDAAQIVGELSMVYDMATLAQQFREFLGFQTLLSLTALALLGGAILFLLNRVLSRPLRASIKALDQLSEGDTETAIPAARSTETRAISAALDRFRQSLMERHVLAVEQAAKREAEQARQAASDRLAARLADVSARAADGDFSVRMDTADLNEDGTEIATQINALLTQTDAGLAAITVILQRLADTDLTQKMDGDFRGVFASVQADANTTIDTLTDLVATLQITASRARSGARTVSQEASNLAGRVQRQATSLEETSATTEEIATVVSKNSQMLKTADNKVRQVNNEVFQGRETIVTATDAMGEIQSSADRITSIISVIESISFQTNLLALNAAVEAARAGESGKGFSVVAAEVRTLAQRSSEAARDIADLIKESSDSVTRGVDLVAQTGTALAKIEGSIAELAETIPQIAEAGTQQAGAVTEISTSIASVDASTQENATAAERTVREMEQLGHDIDALERQVAVFKTPDPNPISSAA